MDIVINGETNEIPKEALPLTRISHYYEQILSCLDYPLDHLPVADLLRQYHGLTGEWLIVSPMHWQATHNDAMIIVVDRDLTLDEEEAKQWFNAFEEFVKTEDITLVYHNAFIWLMQMKQSIKIKSISVYRARNQSLMPLLSQLDSTLFWQRFITEAQMFFSAHQLNKNNTHHYPINGIWIWGEGQLRKNRSSKPIIVDNMEATKLAKILSSTVLDYEVTQSYPRDSLFLLQSSSHQAQFKVQSNKNITNWYWNNVAYTNKPVSWLTRLWRQLKHAH